MNLKDTKSKLLIVAVLFAIAKISLFVLIWYLMLGLRPDQSLKTAIEHLKYKDSSLIHLNLAKQDISYAENYYRDYLSTKDTGSRNQFVAKLEGVSQHLEQVDFTDTAIAAQLKNEMGQKLDVAATISSLKGLADQLLADTYAQSPSLNTSEIRLGKISTSILKNHIVHKVDTLKAVQEKKGFFKKIFGGADSTKYQLAEGGITEDHNEERTETGDDTQPEYDQLATAVSKFYQDRLDQQMRLRNSIDRKEQALASVNMSIMRQINTGIQNIADQVDQLANEKSIAAIQDIESDKEKSLANRKLFLWLTLAFMVIITVIFIFYYRTYLNEEAAKKKANQLADLKARMLSSMSHEIRSPLTAIMGFAEQLVANPSIQFNVDYLGAIKKSSEHLLTTVNDILDYSKLDKGKFNIVKEDFSVREILEDVIFNFSILAEKKDIYLKLNSNIPKDLILTGDAFRLKQILINLVTNGIKFTQNGGVEVIANTKTSGTDKLQLEVTVKDTGKGIPADQLNLIFDEFTQVTGKKGNALDARKGTGLGLFISKMLVELQGGSISVASEVGKGSEFTFSLPYEVSKHKISLAPKQMISEHFEHMAGKRVLMVEDSPINIMLLGHLLKKYKINFDVVQSGDMAWKTYQEENYDLVLTDINVPELSGDELAMKIRGMADQTKAKVPIVALTAEVLWEEQQRYAKAGIDKVVAKPFKEAEFIRTISPYLKENRKQMVS